MSHYPCEEHGIERDGDDDEGATCSRCHDMVSVGPGLEWEDGDVCWECMPDVLAETTRHAATWKALAKRLRAQLDSTWSIIVSLRAELAEPPMCEPWCGVPGASPIKGSRLAWCHFACRDADRPLRPAPPQDVTAAVEDKASATRSNARARVAEAEAEMEAARAGKAAAVALLRRIQKYAREDRMQTPGYTRLARVIEEIDTLLPAAERRLERCGRLWRCEQYSKEVGELKRPAPPQDVTAAVDKLRADGWMVAVHNDYRLSGKAMTFWLFTHPDGRWIKGEGTSDDEAISKAAAQIKVSAVVVTAAVEAVCRCGHSESFHDNDEGANDGGECMFFSREMGMCSCNWLAPKDAHPSVPQRCAPEQHRWCDPYQIHISHGDDPWLRACDECGISIYTTAPEAAPVDMPRDVRKAIYADLPSLYTTSPTPEAAPVPDAPPGVRSVLKVNPFYPPHPPIATPPAEPPTAEPYSRRCPADSGGEPADDDNGCMADDAAEGLCAPGFCAGVNNWKGGLVWPCPDGTKAATPPAEPDAPMCKPWCGSNWESHATVDHRSERQWSDFTGTRCYCTLDCRNAGRALRPRGEMGGGGT